MEALAVLTKTLSMRPAGPAEANYGARDTARGDVRYYHKFFYNSKF